MDMHELRNGPMARVILNGSGSNWQEAVHPAFWHAARQVRRWTDCDHNGKPLWPQSAPQESMSRNSHLPGARPFVIARPTEKKVWDDPGKPDRL